MGNRPVSNGKCLATYKEMLTKLFLLAEKYNNVIWYLQQRGSRNPILAALQLSKKQQE
jgi:hypothetical protein